MTTAQHVVTQIDIYHTNFTSHDSMQDQLLGQEIARRFSGAPGSENFGPRPARSDDGPCTITECIRKIKSQFKKKEEKKKHE
jgi:hypothetical protein